MLERNKELSRRYHELDPGNFDEILTQAIIVKEGVARGVLGGAAGP